MASTVNMIATVGVVGFLVMLMWNILVEKRMHSRRYTGEILYVFAVGVRYVLVAWCAV